MAIWDLNQLYTEEEKESFKGQLLSDVENFTKVRLNSNIPCNEFNELLDRLESITLQSHVLIVKAQLKTVEDQTNSTYLRDLKEYESLFTDISNKLLFFTHFYKNLDEKNALRLQEGSGRFRYYLESVRRAIPHMRLEEEEKIISIKDLSGVQTLTALRDIISAKRRFTVEGKELVEEELRALWRSEDASVRKKAYDAYYNEFSKFEDVLGMIYMNVALDWRNETVDIRKHKTSISARNFSNTLPDEVVELVLDVVREKRHVFQNYFKQKFTHQSIPLSRYNIYAPYPLSDSFDFPYEKSKEITLDVFKSFSPVMYELAKKIFDSNRVHSEVIPNKRSGAFCLYYGKSQIPFIMLNHTDDYNSLRTMCHEFGHGVHGQMAPHTTEFTFDPPQSTAETASVFGELLLQKHLYSSLTEDQKKFVLTYSIDQYFATILRQTYFVLFEKKAHEMVKKGTTPEELSNMYLELLREQFGDMEVPDSFKYEWLTVPHIYETPFYCYAYSFACLVVLALYNKYEHEGEEFIPKYLDILRSGGDADVKDILLKAGFDITSRSFWEGAFDVIEKDINMLNSLYK